MKQTAVEWLVNELEKFDIHQPIKMSDWNTLKELSEQAKEMEQQQQGYSEEEVIEFTKWVLLGKITQFEDNQKETLEQFKKK